ncbi:CDP-glycerol glycerophosphotransferase family protein [Bacillales bacterium AN1005]
MQQRSIFISFENGQPEFKQDFCDFNGLRSIMTQKKKYNTKYLVYKKDTGKSIAYSEIEPLTILETIVFQGEKIVFYLDNKGRVSFVKTKQKNLPIMTILDKIEKAPFYKNYVFTLFQFFILIGVMRFRNYNFLDVSLALGYDKVLHYPVRFFFPQKIREKYSLKTGKLALLVHSYWVRIPTKDIFKQYMETSYINNPIYVSIKNEGINYIYPLKASSTNKYNKEHYIFNTRSSRLKKGKVEIFIRKSITGQYVIVLTSILNRLVFYKEIFAFFSSLIYLNRKKYDVYFEKFSAGASESAFELFKYSHENGDRCVYILDKEHPDYSVLKKRYKRSLAAKNSFLAFYYIFLGRSFLSSDLVSHLQRRLYDNDSLMKRKILQVDKKFFLQHGVCLATNVFERGYFNRKVPIAPDYIVTNSAYESRLFIQNTDYTEQELIPTGLPNLDLYVNTKRSQKDEITFMLTWRPWDLTGKIEEGSYLDRYLSFITMIQKEPFYQGKLVNVILHPKAKIILQEQFPEIYREYESSLFTGDIKEALLKTKVLISDYSSVVFYAFAGGSNIVFYWEDKKRAEREYGSPNILQEEIAFGSITNDFCQLHEVIISNYNKDQSKQDQNKYSVLVENTNGKNTENTYTFIQKHILFSDESIPLETSPQFLYK